MKSMTGFGIAKLEKNDRIYKIEIKSVNHKYNDISIKIPKSLSYIEDKVKKEISKSVARGKIDVYIAFENYSNLGKQIIINNELANQYIEQFKLLAQRSNLSVDIPITEIMKLPDVVTIKETQTQDNIIEEELLECLKEAIDSFKNMREQEGNKIKEDLLVRIIKVEDEVKKISNFSTGLIEEYVVKLKQRIKEILKSDIIDETRLATEVVIYADKCSIEEEVTRLKSHISQFKNMLEEEKVGKKLDFLIQEMNRETNTIGSKSGSLEITNSVISIKTQLEDIREQIQNIE